MPHKSSPDDYGGKHSRGLAEREDAKANGPNGEAIKDQRRRIVRQSFALEDHNYSSGDLHSTSNGERCDGIGRRNDSA